MEPWVWLALALAGFALLQVMLYRYLQRGAHSEERPPTSPGARTGTGRDAGRTGGDGRLESVPDDGGVVPDTDGHREAKTDVPDTDRVQCTHCGERNERDAVFTYCRRCGHELR